VSRMCKVLGVSRSGYYAWRRRGQSVRARQDAELVERIRRIHRESRGTYGTPRVHAELLLGQAIRCSRKRVARLMRLAGLAGVHRRRPSGCTVLDAFSRRVVGWAMGARAKTELVLDALDMAVWNRGPGPGVVHHSDHGCQYTSVGFTARLQEAGILGSMGTVGDAFDNAAAESFFATLQTELLDRGYWATRQSLTTAIFSYIEGFYNRKRRHSTLGYLSPKEYESVALNSKATTELAESQMVAS
jgi:putative transposase